jgi:2-haloacid dehalogenase
MGRETACNAVVFDLGGVLIHWDPRLLYRKMLPTEAAVEQFLATVCTPEWNARQDAGRPFDEGIAELVSRFPDQADLIEAWRDRFDEMLLPKPDSVEVVRQLRERGVPLYALSNWGAETFDATRHLFPFLEWFDGLFISGKVGLMKPDPAFYHLLLREHTLDAAEVAFVDDHIPNVEAARQIGFRAFQFTSAAHLRGELERLGLL